jgi:hypothetical protein
VFDVIRITDYNEAGELTLLISYEKSLIKLLLIVKSYELQEGSTVIESALAMVLWYHPRLISERSLVRFPVGCTKNFLSPLPLSPHRLTSYFDVWRHLPSAK